MAHPPVDKVTAIASVIMVVIALIAVVWGCIQTAIWVRENRRDRDKRR